MSTSVASVGIARCKSRGGVSARWELARLSVCEPRWPGARAWALVRQPGGEILCKKPGVSTDGALDRGPDDCPVPYARRAMTPDAPRRLRLCLKQGPFRWSSGSWSISPYST